MTTNSQRNAEDETEGTDGLTDTERERFAAELRADLERSLTIEEKKVRMEHLRDRYRNQ